MSSTASPLFLTAEERHALKRVLKMLQVRPGGFILSLVLGVAGLGSAVALAATSAWLIARASQMPPVLYLAVAATAVRMFGIFRALFRYLQRLASHKVALSGMDSLRLGIYRELMDGPANRVAGLKRGDLLNRTGADVDQVGDLVVKSILPTCVTAIVAVGTVVGFALVSIPAAIVLALCLLVSGVVAPIISMRSTRLAALAQQETQRQLAIETHTVIEGAAELQVSGTLPQALSQFQATSARISEARGLAARPEALASALDKVAMGFAVVGVFLVATNPASVASIPAVMFAVLILTPLAAFEGTAELGAASAQLVRSADAAVRISELLGEPVPPPITHHLPVDVPTSVEARELSVGWPGGPVVASGISLTLTPGRRIAIVGPSGIGKTTLLYTLAGMLPPKGGEALTNGVASWDADRHELTARVSLTTEDAHVFATSVYENLRVADASLSPQAAKTYLHDVGLGEWLAALPDGLDTVIGSEGTTISGGERRRLLLARALASPAPLMLLDEPGEHLDAATAQHITRRLMRKHREERGILIVTHRLSELSEVDHIIVLERRDGHAQVTAAGTHSELLASSGYYRHALGKEQ